MVLVFFLLQIILIAFRLNCYGIKITNNPIDLKLINISYFSGKYKQYCRGRIKIKSYY